MMSDAGARLSDRATFDRVVLIDDAERCRKLLTGGGFFFRGYDEGTLHVMEGAVRWQDAARTVTLPGVTSATLFRNLFIRIDREGPDGPAVVFLQDRSRGGGRAAKTTKELLPRLREALGLAPPSPEERAAETVLAVAQAESAMRSARGRMVVSGLVAIIGAILTLRSYSSADPGGGYTLYWGAMLFGALSFLVGVGEYRTASKAKVSAVGGARTPPSAPAPTGVDAPAVPIPAAAAPTVAMWPAPVAPAPPPPPPPALTPSVVMPAVSVRESAGPRGAPMHDTTLGIRFDIGRLGVDAHGLAAWRVIWGAVDPATLGQARFLEGDTAGTLAHREDVFCVAVEASPPALHALRAALEASADFAQVASTPAFLDASEVEVEPLVPAGSIGTHGELEGRWPAAGLNAARERSPVLAGVAGRTVGTGGAPAPAAFAPAGPTVATAPETAPTVVSDTVSESLTPTPPGEGTPTPPSGRRPRRWALLGMIALVLAVVAAAVALLGGGGGGGGPLATAEEVEAEIVAVLEESDLSVFGDPAVLSVTCPAVLPSEPGQGFECDVELSTDPSAVMEVGFSDDEGTIQWCSLQSDGAFMLSASGLDACGDADGDASASTTTTAPEVITTAPPVTSGGGGFVIAAPGTLAIDDVYLTNQYPRGCQPTDLTRSCLTSSGNLIVVLVVHAAPGQVAEQTMEAITAEAFESTIRDDMGVVLPANQISATHGADTLDVVYAFLAVENPTSLTLQWPGNGPVELDL